MAPLLPLRTWLTVLLFALAAFVAHAQPTGSRVEILNADALRFDDRLNGAQHLTGNVRLKHGDALMYCDSAYVFPDQRVEAFGRIRIEQGDSLRLSGDRLLYNGADRVARVDGNVRLNDKAMELTTPSIDHDLRSRVGRYTAGGRIVNSRDGSVLTSEAGSYYSDAHRFVFARNVRLESADRLIVSDTMHYVTSTGVAEFKGPTTITQGRTVIHTQRGNYDTRNERAVFTGRTDIDSNGRLLEGDSLWYDRNTGMGIARGHVAVTDSSGDIRALGEVGHYNEQQERSMITGRAELVMRMGPDTLYLHGDSLFITPDSIGRRIVARQHVRFFRSDLQGVCDTLIYSDADSLIHLIHRPALWSGVDQITGTRMRLALKNGVAHRLYVDGNALLLSQADSIHYDQVMGTTMEGFFEENELSRLLMEGNCRTVYFAREEKDGVEQIIGVNRADCSRIAVGLEDGQVATVSFMDRPDAVLYPLEKAPPEELRMKDTDWRGEQRPVDRSAIFLP